MCWHIACDQGNEVEVVPARAGEMVVFMPLQGDYQLRR
jgi:hypothetical protein